MVRTVIPPITNYPSKVSNRCVTDIGRSGLRWKEQLVLNA